MSKSKARRLAEEGPRAKNKAEHWIIVDNPWHLSHHRRITRLRENHLQEIAWWLQVIFGKGKIRTVQHRSNHPFVIATVDPDVDIAPMLGLHNWGSFLVDATTYERLENSKIFEYAYIKNGDQSEKGWDEYIPLPRIAPHNFPVISPYPPPTWCAVQDVPAGWALPIQPPDTTVDSEPEEPLHVTSPPFHEESKLRLSLPNAGPAWETFDTPSHVAAPISSPSYQPGSSSSSLTNDPRRRLNAFLTNQQPSHHPLTLSGDDAHAEEKKPIKREPSPIRVPYHTYFPEVEEKMKNHHSATATAWKKMDNEEIKGNESFNIPDIASDFSYILIRNPYGIDFATQEGSPFPVINEAWDWLQLIADGAWALYYDVEHTLTPGHNWVVAQVSNYVDLKGVLGQHRWDQILWQCPRKWADNVSTILPYLGEPESEGLHRLDAPEMRENYEQFRVPYPAPLPLPDDYEGNTPMAKIYHVGSNSQYE